jgi:PAS domain-containing protein
VHSSSRGNNDAAREQEKKELMRIADVQAAAHAHLSRLLNASPAVIYCRQAANNYQPTFVSESIRQLFDVTPKEYFENPDLWRQRVHPEDVDRLAAWVAADQKLPSKENGQATT